jgi:hypothetical protein
MVSSTHNAPMYAFHIITSNEEMGSFWNYFSGFSDNIVIYMSN